MSDTPAEEDFSPFKLWLRLPDGRTTFLMTVAGLVILLSAWSMLFVEKQGGLLERSRLPEIVLEIAAGLLVVGIADLTKKRVRISRDSLEYRDFAAFFGEGVFDEPPVAVFPTARPQIDEHGCCNFEYSDPPDAAKEAKAKAKGVEHVIPYEDLRAAVALSQLFQRWNVKMAMSLDRSYAVSVQPTQRGSLIGIGLGFNHVTAKFAGMRPELFTLKYTDGTDDFDFCGEPHGFSSNEEYDCALVVRIAGHGGDAPHFICAGRAATGTAAAGFYVANHWRDMLRFYRQQGQDLSNDTLAILLRFPIRSPEYADAKRIRFNPSKNSAVRTPPPASPDRPVNSNLMPSVLSPGQAPDRTSPKNPDGVGGASPRRTSHAHRGN